MRISHHLGSLAVFVQKHFHQTTHLYPISFQCFLKMLMVNTVKGLTEVCHDGTSDFIVVQCSPPVNYWSDQHILGTVLGLETWLHVTMSLNTAVYVPLPQRLLQWLVALRQVCNFPLIPSHAFFGTSVTHAALFIHWVSFPSWGCNWTGLSHSGAEVWQRCCPYLWLSWFSVSQIMPLSILLKWNTVCTFGYTGNWMAIGTALLLTLLLFSLS